MAMTKQEAGSLGGNKLMSTLSTLERKALAASGGIALSRKLSASQRSESARIASEARWAKHRELCKVVKPTDAQHASA